MSEKRFVQPLPIYQQTLKRLQWDGKYWGENGALEYARRNSDLVELTPVGWVSLRYSAAGNAWTMWRANRLAFWWPFRFISTFCPAFLKARELAENHAESLSADECSVVGAVLARGGCKELAVRVLEQGISQRDVLFETEALLYAELHELGRMPAENVWAFVWGFTHAPYNVEQAKKPCGVIAPEQLARILRKVGLSHFAEQLAKEAEAWDQVLKSRA